MTEKRKLTEQHKMLMALGQKKRVAPFWDHDEVYMRKWQRGPCRDCGLELEWIHGERMYFYVAAPVVAMGGEVLTFPHQPAGLFGKRWPHRDRPGCTVQFRKKRKTKDDE